MPQYGSDCFLDTFAAKKTHTNNCCFAIVRGPLTIAEPGIRCVVVVDGPEHFEHHTAARECFGIGNLMKPELKQEPETYTSMGSMFFTARKVQVDRQNLGDSYGCEVALLTVTFCAKLDSPGVYTGHSGE